MSIRFPGGNIDLGGGASGSVSLDIPAGSNTKAANTGFVVGAWVSIPENGHFQNRNYNILSRATGLAGGADGYIRVDTTANTISARMRNGGADILASVSIAVTRDRTYLVMLIANVGNTHLVVCEPGQSPTVATVASGGLYASSLSGSNVFTKIGSGTSTSTYGIYYPIENAFFLGGLFPESGGIPDNTLIQNIANGTQSLATLDAQLTSGVKRWNYSLRTAQTLTDEYGVAAALTASNATVDRVIMTSGPLRPTSLMPTKVLPSVSQVRFGTVGDAASARADIIAEGGTYSGITPSSIQARLLKEDGSVYVDWTVVDPAPTGGAWQPYTFTNLTMTAGRLNLEYRAVDGGGAQIGQVVGSHGTKGTGFHFIMCSQSQGVIVFDTPAAGLAVPPTLRARISLYTSSAELDPSQPTNFYGRGIRQAAVEINTLFPGVPMHFSNMGLSGNGIEQFIPGGSQVARWAGYKSFAGVIQPYVFWHYGHSSGADVSYQTYLNDYIGQAVSNFGTPLKILHAPTARYAQAGTGSNYTQVEAARNGTRARVAANPSTDWIAGNWQTLKNDSSDNGPHPFEGASGVGRAGAYIAWAMMAWARAVADEPLKLKATRTSDTRVTLTFERYNSA